MIYKIVITIFGLLFLSAEGLELGHLQSRIIGGFLVPDNKYPFMVSLRNATSHHCGGAIIGEDCILTNAACSVSARIDTVIVVGTNDLTSGGTVYQVSETFQPPGHNGTNFQNNIGIIKTVGTIQFNDRVKPIRISTTDPRVGSSCTLAGWGLRSFPAPAMSPNLYEISLRRISDLTCNRTSQPEYPLIHKFCTENNERHAPCTGDLGGPLFCEREVKGVLSTLKECGTRYPDTFESIKYWNNWIKSVCNIKVCPK